MASIEKKFSDFQENECKPEISEQISEDNIICPTCQIDENWVLPASHWSDIEEAYLNEKFCEYRVMVFENDVAVLETMKTDSVFDLTKEQAIIEVGVERIILFTNKKLSNSSRQDLIKAASISDQVQTVYGGKSGLAYLISVPAFNVDTLENDPIEEENSNTEVSNETDEILLSTNQLRRKIKFLRLSLRTYGYFYSALQKESDGFIIRQEANETLRISYSATIKKIKQFEDSLNNILKRNNLPRLGRFAPFHSAQLESIKILFKEGEEPYLLDSIYVLTSKSCNEYLQLDIPNSSPLFNYDMQIVYHFLNNIEKIYKEVTAAETKPWLEFTLENFYPTYVVDYGNVVDTKQIKSGLECLLESQLGIGNGKVVDSLASEIVSAFDRFEEQMNKQACRSLNQVATEGGTALSERDNTPSAAEQRKLAMVERYKKEFENKWYDTMRSRFNEFFKNDTKENYKESEIRTLVQRHPEVITSIVIEFQSREAGEPVKYHAGNISGMGINKPEIRSAKDLESHANRFASLKFTVKEDGNFRDQIGNSPHFQEALDASLEVLEKFDNTYIDTLKDAYNNRKENLSMDNVISVLGVCGLSKIAGKAFECLAGGISFDAFMESLIEKIFEFMEVNTLDLFFNGLPATFRDELEEAIKEQLGSNIDFFTLLELKKTENGAQKMADFVKSMAEGRRMLELFEKYEDPRTDSKVTVEEKQFLESRLGTDSSRYDAIIKAFGFASYSRKSKSYPSEKISLPKPKNWPGNIGTFDDYKERKPKKWVLKVIKEQARQHKSRGRRFLDGLDRVGSAIGQPFREAGQLISGSFAENDLENEILETQEEIISIELEYGTLFEMDNRIEELNNQILLKQDQSQDPLSTFSSGEIISLQNQIVELQNQISRVETLIDTLSTSKEKLENLETVGTAIAGAIDPFVVTKTRPGELNQLEIATKSFKTNRIGAKVDIVFDVIFDFVIDSIIESFSVDDLLNELRSYPIVDFALDKVMDLFLDPCPTAPIISPPPSDFLKSFTFDICDGTAQVTVPQIIIPNIDFRFQIEYQFGEIFREAIIKLVSDIILKVMLKLLKTLEGALCKLAESAGNFISDALKDGLPGTTAGVYNGFLDALNEAFCNDGVNPDTSKSKASELADALFDSVSFNPDGEYESAGDKATNVISSVSSQNEILEAMVSREGEGNEQFYSRVSNAVKSLAPEMVSLLGSPNQVAYFFRSVGSFLSPDDRERIRNLLDAGVPNLPVSPALCLTNDQLNEWNSLRESILSGDNPEEAVDKLNDATEDAFEDILDTIGDIETDGPFIGSLTNEIAKDVCNPNNLINDVSQSDFDKEAEDDQIDDFYENILKSLKIGFFSKGGLLAEAMRDSNNNREFERSLQKLFRINYSNSQEERDSKYESKATRSGRKSLGQLLMGVGYDEELGAPGVYPDTVGLLQRENILGDDGIRFNFRKKRTNKKSSENIAFVFKDELEGSHYERSVACSNIKDNNRSFNYNLQIIEKIDSSPKSSDMSINVIKKVDEKVNEFMKQNGFNYIKNSKEDIRKELFVSLLEQKVPNLNHDMLYEKALESFTKNLCNGLLTNYEDSTLLPNGYKFGYKTNPLTKESYDYLRPDKSDFYDLEEEEQILGKFRDDKNIIPLNPKIYGGKYSNPPYYVMPRNHTGWYELAQKAFDSNDGCDPKTPPILNFSDISENTKNLSTSLRNNPSLSDPEECRKMIPFNLLLDSKSKARLDGVVRSTLRAYLAEFYIQGYGLFSNISMKQDNFDDSLFTYIAKRIKSEMIDLGGLTSNKKIRIVRERYWYTFLEQVVEAYQNDVDVNGVVPPDHVSKALSVIGAGCDLYQQINKQSKREIRKLVRTKEYYRPRLSTLNPVRELTKGIDHMAVMAIAFRLSDEEERENFMDGGLEERVSASTIRFTSLKKLQFFQKIFFIKLFERQALLIMSEFIKSEFRRMSKIISDGPLDNPYYDDLKKSIMGMKSIFPSSNSRVGLSSYEVEKLVSEPDVGDIPDIKDNNSNSGLDPSEEVRFLIEKYIKLEDKEGEELPQFFTSRNEIYKNYAKISSFSDFIDNNMSNLEGKYLSSFFGSLKFLYKTSFSKLLEQGFNSQEDLRLIASFNEDEGITFEKLNDLKNKHLLDLDYEDLRVFYDDSFVLSDELPEPSKTIGSAGVKFGIRLSIVVPQSISDSYYESHSSDLSSQSLATNSYVFGDGILQIPLVETEVDVIDKKFENFNPEEEFDLECIINKMVKSPEFLSIFDLSFGASQTSSMLSLYCIETLPASIGRHPTERREGITVDVDTEDWDRTVNKFAKNFLRREFKSIYLSRTDSAGDESDDNDFSLPNLFTLNNPFENFSFPGGLPWWLKRRMKTKVLDSNQVECADPEKDLQ